MDGKKGRLKPIAFGILCGCDVNTQKSSIFYEARITFVNERVSYMI